MTRAIASLLLSLVAVGVPDARAAQLSNVAFTFDAMVQDQFVVLHDPKLERRVREIVANLAAASSCAHCQGTVRIINDPLPNVFSGPESHLYLTTGLLDLVSSEDELAAVLARELSYISRAAAAEYFRKKKKQKILIDILVLGGVGAISLVFMASATASAATVAEFEAASQTINTLTQVTPGVLWTADSIVSEVSQLESLSTPSVGLAERSAALRRLRDRAYAQGNEEDAKALDREVRKLEFQWEALVRRIRDLLPEYSAMRFPQPVAPSELDLNPSEVFVKYHVLPQETIVFTFKEGALLAASVIEQPRTHLEDAVKEYVDSLTVDMPDFDLGHRLYAELLAPVLDSLDPESELVIAAAPPLDKLPFGALVARAPAESVSRGDGETATPAQYLDELWGIRYVYSAGVLKGIADRSAASEFDAEIFLAAVDDYSPIQGDSTESTESGVEEQCRTIDFSLFSNLRTSEFAGGMLDLFADSESVIELNPSEGTVRDALSGRRFRFLSLAGHATDSRLPYLLEPAFVLTPAKASPCFEYDDSLLTVSEIAMLELGSDVALLTACSTATGETIVPGEGTMSLARAFQAAGVTSVVGTLWPVEVGSALEFSRLFLTYMRDGKSGIEALRLSRLQLKEIEGYSSPRHWAAFVLVGAS